MTDQSGQHFELSEDIGITLHHDGRATLVTDDVVIYFTLTETDALRRAFVTQDAKEARATLEAMRDDLTNEPGFPTDYNPKDL